MVRVSSTKSPVHTFSYKAYGLGISSALPFPELVADEEAADVVVRLGKVDCLPSEGSSWSSSFRPTTDEAYLSWKEVGRFLVREGGEIIVEPASGVEERVLRLFILGPVLAMLLHQRGLLILHASAVELEGGAVAFLGGPKWGKSTTAAALCTLGHGFVADDVVALSVDGEQGPTLFSGFPQLKLWPEALTSLGKAPETLPLLHPQMEKRAHRSIRGFSQHSLPLRRVYVLDEGPTQEIEIFQPQEALVELVRHSYLARLLQTTETSKHFLQCARIVNSVPVRRLRRPRSLSALLDLARFIEDDAINGN